eukprot:CAMPEP_0174230630 /NCGR_PEP_ID=MMETSP0417-20130205/1357_1 /TAXON_ID=242541 /ORGANISM="Mayorella sp, Strain BSH-02190019" /LENGTH=403 /DNA_ID=CAMNT_0015308361 /DNA_START=170 /DNA_END=1378 /DNA_ORIENTATION=-
MGMIAHCYAAVVILFALGYYEWTVRKDVLLSLNAAEVVQYYANTLQESFWPWALLLPAYILALVVGSFVVPGFDHQGTPVSSEGVDAKGTPLPGKRYTFKINGFRLFVLLLAGVTLLTINPDIPINATVLYDHYAFIFFAANAISFALSFVLYVKGASNGKTTGNVLKDFWVGTELMPHFGKLNVKFFWLRPSMMLWILINLSMLAKHIELMGHITPRMALYQAFTMLYVADYFWFEEYMTSTWDIVAEHFGFMLVWGDFVFIPFVFSVQTWFLLENAEPLSTVELIGMISVFVIGYIVFRGSNKQKHDYKHNPQGLIWGKKPVVVGRLLASGWWGLSRHPNYWGDIMLGIAYSLPCGFGSVLPWVYPIYLTLLLVHRFVRDDERCSQKYKDIWVKYCNTVPY